MLTLNHFLYLADILFAISIVGIFINRKNMILLLMCIELLLLAVNFNFIAFSHFLNDVDGQIFVFFILTVAAAEAAITSREQSLAQVDSLKRHPGSQCFWSTIGELGARPW